MLQKYWLIILLISILIVFYFDLILFLFTTLFIILFAIYLAFEVNTRDLKEVNYFKNNQLFDLNEEINLIGKEDFQRTSLFNCLSSISSKISPIQQLFNWKQIIYQKKFTNKDDNKSNEIYTGDAKIDEQINDLINLVLRDYVYSWYSNVSSNQEFINELKTVLQSIIRLLVGRISRIDKIHYITIKLVDNFIGHLKLYRMAKQHLKANNIALTDENLIESFFNFELQSESNKFCRDGVSENDKLCLNYLTELTSILEYLILPPDLFNNRPIKYFVNTIIINSTFFPILNLLADPDFINQSLISLCKTRKFNCSLSESFIIILRLNANKEELNAVLESLREEIASQRSRDTGGDDDFGIKQQLSSLCYVNSIIKERLKSLKEGDNSSDSKINQEENNNFHSNSNDLYSLNFDFVLSNPLALTYFFEYMITIGKQSYLNFYLSVEGFRLSVEQKLVAIQMKESQELLRTAANDQAFPSTAIENGDLTKNDLEKEEENNKAKEIKEGQLAYDSNEDLNEEEIVKLNSESKHMLELNDDKTEDQKLIDKLELQMKRKLEKLKEDNDKAIWLNNLILRAKEEAQNIYDTYLSPVSAKQHRIVVDDWLIQDLKHKIDNDDLSETWFDTIHSLIYRRLREEEMFFSSFKKSIHYYKLLKELSLLKSSHLRDKANLLNNNDTKTVQSTNSSNSINHQSTKPTFYIDVDNDNSSVKSNYSSYDNESLTSQDRKSTTELQEISNLLNRDEPESNDKQSSFIQLDADITSSGITREFGKEFGVYCINIVKKDYQSFDSDSDFKEDKWCIVRRYSDFYTFHQHTIKLFPQLSKIGLPGKKPFANSMTQEFLEQRKQSLNSYLKNLLDLSNNVQIPTESNLDKNKLRDHILQFFESGNYLPKLNKSSSNNNQILTKTMKTVLNPLKLIKNKPGNLIENITKIKPFGSNNHNNNQKDKQNLNNQQSFTQSQQPNRLTSANHLSSTLSSNSLSNSQTNQHQPNSSPKNQPTNLSNQLNSQSSTNAILNLQDTGAKQNNLIETETNNIPLRILLQLMDEIFDLKTKSFWLRRRIFNVIKQIIQTTYGSTINRKIILFINRLFSSSYIESYIKNIKKTLWPNGYRAIPNQERSNSIKMRTRIATKMLLLSIMSDDLSTVVGSDSSRKSVMGLFNMLQCNVLNRRLIIVIFETFLIQLFPENEFDKVFERLHSANSKHQDKLETQLDSTWPPYLYRVNKWNSNQSTNSDQSSSKTSPIYSKF